MEKKNFVTLVMGVLGGLLFSLGMCMCLIPEWAMFQTGVVFGVIGGVILLITLVAYMKMSGKKTAKPNWKVVGKVVYGLFATLVFGTGMCLTMVFEGMMIVGILVGIVGIILLLCLIPMCFGWKK